MYTNRAKKNNTKDYKSVPQGHKKLRFLDDFGVFVLKIVVSIRANSSGISQEKGWEATYV
jgi:hypothetical protein